MQLGAFSISLAVKSLAASRAFYEKLGFAHATDYVEVMLKARDTNGRSS